MDAKLSPYPNTLFDSLAIIGIFQFSVSLMGLNVLGILCSPTTNQFSNSRNRKKTPFSFIHSFAEKVKLSAVEWQLTSEAVGAI